jgi:hypothetical protein
MPREQFHFHMPAPAEDVFDVFHYHALRMRWDSLVKATHLIGEAECPYVGAVSQNAGGGMLGACR